MSKAYKFLLIDDDLIFLRIAKFQLEKKLNIDVEVFTAANLAQIEERMEDDYDMVFIDLNMPETTGWEVIERYKDKLKQPSCIALICSSSIDPRDKERADNMSDVIEKMISKPIDIDLVQTYFK